MAIAHIYYFFEDVYPRMSASGGKRYLATPDFVKVLFLGRIYQANPVVQGAPAVPGDQQAANQHPHNE